MNPSCICDSGNYWDCPIHGNKATYAMVNAMNCPHCSKPLDSAQLRKALNAEIAKRKRPGAKGLVRNPNGRPKPPKQP